MNLFFIHIPCSGSGSSATPVLHECVGSTNATKLCRSLKQGKVGKLNKHMKRWGNWLYD